MATDRVSIVSVCVADYRDDRLASLSGPRADALSIAAVFTGDGLGLYSSAQVHLLEDPTSTEVRAWLLNYCATRTASGDILLFYFSGHGSIVGPGQFAFCLADAVTRPDGNGVLPLSVLPFGEVVDTLAAVDVNPVFVIDACYSGAAAAAREISPGNVMALMHDDVHRKAGSSYAMLCACSDRQAAIDEDAGGMFTQTLARRTRTWTTGQSQEAHPSTSRNFPRRARGLRKGGRSASAASLLGAGPARVFSMQERCVREARLFICPVYGRPCALLVERRQLSHRYYS